MFAVQKPKRSRAGSTVMLPGWLSWGRQSPPGRHWELLWDFSWKRRLNSNIIYTLRRLLIPPLTPPDVDAPLCRSALGAMRVCLCAVPACVCVCVLFMPSPRQVPSLCHTELYFLCLLKKNGSGFKGGLCQDAFSPRSISVPNDQWVISSTLAI